MSDTRSIGSRDARAELGRLIDEAHYTGKHVILTKSDEPRAVLVPYSWWQERQTQARSGPTPP
ncbi:type II toxin-antitoxin system Phd/YefM family antitoxin [Streptomyces sp. NBC_01808]|uniref:type II toxin-antitoxin system Phd/YefM family antitoxin n=1 Tax=Streptomyces sp. NBC_01808 TaxID=2975947 RepID=UPI002DDBEA5F|nr:type II toxin-antitoxin system Phd/YefM family antitoxin [Streptomyces sp. NBC_01808]WSA40834.1 type II toxin-antitoxin system Phd/YefM family antitoxin [Streptomyces sp. NBC_01808]